MKVLITREIPEIAKNILLENDIDVLVYSKNKPISKKEIIKYGKDCDGVISLLTDKFDKELIDLLPNCKIIANYAVGYNNIDIQYAKSRNIIVTNTPDILTDATADIAVSLVLACARNIVSGDLFMRKNKFTGWDPKLLRGIELRNKTVGIIGAGRIGQETARRLKAFGTNIVYFSKTAKKEFEIELGAKKVDLDKLLKISDVISMHIPLTDKTRNLLDKDKLELLKEDAILVNTARGEIIDENYLIEMLKNNRIYSAGFDVYLNEPDYNRELLKLDNVVLLPHIGSATYEARDKMAKLCAENIVNVLNGKQSLTPVN